MNQLTPYAPYAISGQTPQDSMVNQYFANQPTSPFHLVLKQAIIMLRVT